MHSKDYTSLQGLGTPAIPHGRKEHLSSFMTLVKVNRQILDGDERRASFFKLNQVILEVCPAHVLNEAGTHDNNVLQSCPGCKCSANSRSCPYIFIYAKPKQAIQYPGYKKMLPPSQLQVGQQSPSDVEKEDIMAL